MKSQPTESNRKSAIILVGFITVLAVLSRLLFMNTNVFFFDGDEAILGLMAKELQNGNFPMYFYGQRYGLSIFETIPIAIGRMIWGPNMLALKIAMLVMWITATIFLGLSVFKILNKKLVPTLLIIGLFILAPTWLIWSMKARGGYLSSFLFSSIIIYLAVWFGHALKVYHYVLVGVLLGFIYECQPLWFPATLVLFILLTLNYENKIIQESKKYAFTAIGAVATLVLLYFSKSGLVNIWDTPSPNFLKRLGSLGGLPETVLNYLGGNYYLFSVYEPSNILFSILFLIVLLFATVVLGMKLVKKTHNRSSLAFFVAMLFSMVGFFVNGAPRYLMPLFGFAILFLASVFRDYYASNRNIGFIVLAVLLLVSVIQLPNLREHTFVNMTLKRKVNRVYDDTKIMNDLIAFLRQNNIQHVYSNNELLQYQINYLADGDITAIGREDRCRTPWNIPKVKASYTKDVKNLAIVGYNFNNTYKNSVPIVGNKIYVLLNPSTEMLRQGGYIKD